MRRWLIALLAAACVGGSARAADIPPPQEPTDLPSGPAGAAITYGFELLADSAEWIGPKGKAGSYTQSRMACGSCHIDAGRRPLGNSWLDTHGLYPQYRAREGKVQTLAERVNACLMHPMLGKPLPENGREMQAILLYYRWIARGRPSLSEDPDTRLMPLAFLDRAADPSRGKKVYRQRCAICHEHDGQGRLKPDGSAYVYPPLWGKESYMVGSSMSRLSLLARFIKGNMPRDAATPDKPVLSDAEAWDVAAYVSAQPHPAWTFGPAFPNNSEKPFDYPIGPYSDKFPESQHLRGPFPPIVDYWKLRQDARSNETGI